jgi:succinate-semialdehyde dehydrogenase/glutarate-semialdehyde dehydrogenase
MTDKSLSGRCLVASAWTGEPTDPVTNPATGDVIAHVPHFGRTEAENAIAAAKAAFPDWSGMLAKERSVYCGAGSIW